MRTQPTRDHEPDEDGLAAITSFVAREADPRKRDLLLRDYAFRARYVDSRARHRYDARLIETIAGRAGEFPERPVPRAQAKPVDIAVLSVQPVEFQALKEVFKLPTKPFAEKRGRRYFETSVPSNQLADRGGKLSAVFTTSGRPTNPYMMRAIADASELYSPGAWFLVGMAAGVEGEVSIGDVVIASRAWAYEPGRLTADGFMPRPDLLAHGEMEQQLAYFGTADPALHSRVRRIIRGADPQRIPDGARDMRPEIIVGQKIIASGEKLLRDGKLLRSLNTSQQLIVAGDQESHGFALACGDAPWMIFRGISDYGDPKKSDVAQYYASLVAATTLAAFLEETFILPGEAPEF